MLKKPKAETDFPFNKVHSCQIHPGIGIARVGNSPEAHFIGPEVPGHQPVPRGGYKDAGGRVRRQAARFRIYAFDKAGNNLGELPIANSGKTPSATAAAVVWNVELANTKGAAHEFYYYHPSKLLRNPAVTDRASLAITPGARTIKGHDVSGESHQFTGGRFLGKEVPLGEIRTDEKGRLLVLGGAGISGAVVPGIEAPDCPLRDYANNDNWHDDIADGPITAAVTLPGDKIVKDVLGAWVIVAPPKFAPGIEPVVTLYEVIRDTAIRAGHLADYPGKVDYFRDIYPLLLRAADMAWVNEAARRGHGHGKRGDYRSKNPEPKAKHPAPLGKPIDADLLASAALCDPKLVAAQKRDGVAEKIFARIRRPLELGDKAGRNGEWIWPLESPANKEAVKWATNKYMPALAGDNGDCEDGKPKMWLAVLPRDYAKLEKWSKGDFDTGTAPKHQPHPRSLDEMTPDAQVEALQRAALEPCVGGAFNPGIEMTYISRWKRTFSGAFRIDASKHGAGDITQYMAVPWQADFYECNTHWWPAQRPDDVVTQSAFEAADAEWAPGSTIKIADGLADRSAWARGIGFTTLFMRPWQNPAEAIDDPRATDKYGRHDMVRYWNEFGVVTPIRTRSHEIVHVERGRKPYAGMPTRRLFHALLNIETHQDCLPKAREYVERVLDAARRVQRGPHAFAKLDNIRSFAYSEEAFETRMRVIYEDTRDFMPGGPQTFDPLGTPYKTREQVIQRIIQLTPFNMLDGSWLRNIHRVGPVDEVNAILYSILNEELGGGIPSQNHANIWLDLCQSVGFYPPPAASSAFADHPAFINAAFDSPTFQLAISEFTKTYYPEIIGMTLFLEWTVLVLHRTADMLDHYGMDSHFYRMHIAIDNAANGHGARIMRAVKLYLDDVRQAGGEQAVQEHWRRIWDGYVAFSYTFSILVNQVSYLVSHDRSPEERLVQLIAEKKPFGQLNHGDKQMGGRSLNDWFDEPPRFLEELIKQGWIVPGKPDESPFFHLLEFEGGRRQRTPVEADPAANGKTASDTPEDPPAPAQKVTYESGRMYKVFSDEEVKLWRDWTIWKGQQKADGARRSRTAHAAAETAEAGSGIAVAAWLHDAASAHRIGAWRELAEQLQPDASEGRPRAVAAAAAAKNGVEASSGQAYFNRRAQAWIAGGMVRCFTHLAFGSCGGLQYEELVLPNPKGEAWTLTDFIGAIRAAENPAPPARVLLAALKDAAAAAPSSDEKKGFDTFAKSLRDPDSYLGRIFDTPVPGNDGMTARTTFDAWLKAGSPLPDPANGDLEPLSLGTGTEEREAHPTGIVFGFGTVH